MFLYLVKYPFFSLFGVCLLLFFTAGIFFNGQYCDVSEVHYILLSTLLIFCQSKHLSQLYMGLTAIFFLAVHLFSGFSAILLVGQIILALMLLNDYKNTPLLIDFIIIALSFFVHLYYIEQIGVKFHQHDLSGISYYMQAITQNGFNLWDFNPWQMYYLFHQPLHFLLAGHISNFAFNLWQSSQLSMELLQYLSLFWVTATVVVADCLFRKLFNKQGYAPIALMFFSFHPSLFLFSGYISDDTPVLFWSVLLIYNVFLWGETNYRKYIVGSALCLGIGTLTKLSVLICVPALFLLFLYQLYTSQNKARILSDLSLFAIIAVPLALLWIIRNHLLFDMQFYNIPDTSPEGQNFRYLTLWERIAEFSSFFTPFIQAPSIAEKNIWLALIKTELFGEWNLSHDNALILGLAYLLYFFNIFLKIVVLGCCFYIIKNFFYKKSPFFSVFMVLIYLISWLYAIKYAMDYPYVCSSDYRLFATGLMFEEIAILFISMPHTKISLKILSGISILYATSVCLIYLFFI